MHCLWSQTRGIVEKNHDRPMFDASDPDWQRAFKYFVANFQDFCIMEDFITPAKDETTEGNGCSTKGFSFSRMGCSYNYHRHSNLRRQQTKPCGVASRANRALPGSRANNPKYSPFSENSKEPTMSIQDWQTAVRLSFQKCNFPIKAEDRLRRDIFVIGLNDT